VDEIDKIAGSVGRLGLDVSRAGVQRALLKPMEETDVDLKVPHDMISQIEAMEHYRATGKREKKSINTRNILFIMSGAFDGLAEIIGKRVHRQTIGFEGAVLSPAKAAGNLALAKSEDLVQFGFEREFVGRLPVCAVLEELTAADLKAILVNPNCALINAKRLDFLVYGIQLAFDPEIYTEIANQALAEKTGARGLVGVVENLLLPFEKTLPSTAIRFLTVDAAVVQDPEAELQRLLTDAECRRQHEARFYLLRQAECARMVILLREKKAAAMQRLGLAVTPERLTLMAKQIVEESCDIDAVCDAYAALVHHIQEWQQTLSEKYQLQVTFAEEAVDHILAQEPCTVQTIDTLCQRLMQFLEYGLRLIRQKQEVTEVVIPAAGVTDPEKFINELVEKAYKG
jgi:hypothetical protein